MTQPDINDENVNSNFIQTWILIFMLLFECLFLFIVEYITFEFYLVKLCNIP